MTPLGWAAHAAIFLALVVNLWFGGDLIEARLGHVVRVGFELVLIGAWLILVVGMRAPLPPLWRWRRRPPEDGEGERRP